MPTFAEEVIDNIALEGLEGITLSALWFHLSRVLELSLPLPEHIQEKVWTFVKRNNEKFQFYVLPRERPPYTILNRLTCIDPDLGIPISEKNEYPKRFKFAPVQSGEETGSCEFYKERENISFPQLKVMTVKEVAEEWGEKFVIVASQELRFEALTPINKSQPTDLTATQYAVLEAIGRARQAGETTNGPHSLLNYCNDAMKVFYIKNCLLQRGMIAVETFHEQRANRVVASTILTLPRFHRTYKSRLVNIIEKLFVVVMASPDKRLPLKDALAEFNKTGSILNSLKKVSSTHHFRRIFEIRMMPRNEIMTETSSPKEREKCTKIKVISLRNTNLTIENLFEEEADPYDECFGEEDFYSCKHAHIDMPPEDEVYRVIAHYGTVGCSQTEICDYLGLNPFTTRILLKHLTTNGLVKTYTIDRGRQRITMYVALEHYGTVKKERDKTLEILDNLQCSTEPNTAEMDDIILPDIPDIKARIKPSTFELNITGRQLTQRQVQRRTIIVKTINERCIIQFGELRAIIQRLEKEQGYTDEACQKSVRRLLDILQTSDVVRLYTIQLDFNEHTRLYNYATHPKIDMDHIILKREILKLKNGFFMAIEERRLKVASQLKTQQKISETQSARKSAKTKTATTTTAEEAKSPANTLQINTIRSAPKFMLSRFLHEFLFYIVFELNEQIEPQAIDEPLLQEWLKTEPSLNIPDYMNTLKGEDSNVKAYTRNITWRTFIPPLPAYPDKPKGWVLFNDAIERLPLSLLKKLFRLEVENGDELHTYLESPIRQHYLLSQLSFDIRCKINQSQIQRNYMSIIRLMNNMGLVQVADRNKSKGGFWMYLNRRLQILDTTTTELGYAKINPDRHYESIHCELKNFEDVQTYWTTLQRVCVYTRLGFRVKRMEKVPLKELSFLGSVAFADAPSRDTGELVGDRMGAAGLSAFLFAHQFRKWSWAVHNQAQTKQKMRCTKAFRAGSSAATMIRKGHTALVKALSGNGRIVRRVAINKASGSTTVARKKKPPIRDAIDRDALRNMRTLRCSWRKEEDTVLKMARAVFIYMGSPLVSVFGLLVVGKICRDVMRRTLGSTNKTCQACVRRMHFILKMNRHLPEVPTWLHTLQTSMQMQSLYGGDMVKRLKATYTNRQEYGDALAKHFINILYFLYRHVSQKDECEVPSFSIPDTLSEFEKNFTTQSNGSDDQLLLYTNPTTMMELQVSVVVNVLHSSLCSAMDKTHYNLQAFEIYKHFSEDVLQRAFIKARSDSLVVSIKRRNIQHVTSQLTGPAYLLSSKYRSRLVFLKIPYNMYEAFFAYQNECLAALFKDGGKTTPPELRSCNLGQLFFMAECLSRNLINVNIKLPINILTVDAEQRQTMSPLDRILDHYHCMFDNAPQTEYIKNFESNNTGRQVRVKFHPANLSYKLTYTPYDQIAKLPMRCLHFFCALDHLGQEVEINFNQLLRNDDVDGVQLMVSQCPFKCIMSAGNYMNEIERIVNEKRHELVNLSEMAPQKLLNQALSDCSVKVESTNLLTLVRMLESFWHEKESANELKDFGKVSGNLKANKPVDWPEMCLEILNYNLSEEDNDKNDEYEPTLNKEERIVRAQDVFVVNLPTITIDVGSGAARTESDKKGTYNEQKMSELWVDHNVDHARILQKVLDEAHWTYSDATFQSVAKELESLEFSEQERVQLKLIHGVIQAQKFGMSVPDLLLEFPDNQFLRRSLSFLVECRLVKRVGIATFMYVHKDHIREWLVHTFHIKRLERENHGVNATLSTKKRLHEGDDAEAAPTKKSKSADDGETTKRTVRAPKRFMEAKDEPSTSEPESFKQTIVIKPQPWIRLIGTLNRRVLDRWMGSILTECIVRCGCSVHYMCMRFPHMQPVDLMFLLEVLTDLKCIYLTEIKCHKQTLLTEYEEMEEEIVTELYEPESTFITARPDAIMRLTLFIGKKKYTKEFV